MLTKDIYNTVYTLLYSSMLIDYTLINYVVGNNTVYWPGTGCHSTAGTSAQTNFS